MNELEKVEEKLNKVEKQFEENTLAMEMLKELKKSSQHKFIIILFLIFTLIGTNIGWLIYESQFETVSDTEQVIEDIDEPMNSTFTQTIK